MARHTYVKYINADGMSQAGPEGAIIKETITMDGLDVVKSVMEAVPPEERLAARDAGSNGKEDD
ncbi:MAG: hypothetical protein OXU37_06890 [Thaumarchaeota archaeon]|nr:hypothetical protein [Nitrososphaerota archaeon]